MHEPEKKSIISKLLGGVWAGLSRLAKGFMAIEFRTHMRVTRHPRVVYHMDFLKDGRRSIGHVILFQMIIICMLIALLPYYLATHAIENRYFATTAEGRITPNVGLDQPNIGISNLVSWLSQASAKALTLSYNDYNRRLREASEHFTRRGWRDFTQSLNDEKILRMLKRYRALITTQPLSAPVLLDQGIMVDPDGKRRYFWRFRLNLTSGIIGVGKGTINRNYKIIITVVRVPKLENGKGISIDKWEIVDD